jgi:hypothetical protein
MLLGGIPYQRKIMNIKISKNGTLLYMANYLLLVGDYKWNHRIISLIWIDVAPSLKWVRSVLGWPPAIFNAPVGIVARAWNHTIMAS